MTDDEIRADDLELRPGEMRFRSAEAYGQFGKRIRQWAEGGRDFSQPIKIGAFKDELATGEPQLLEGEHYRLHPEIEEVRLFRRTRETLEIGLPLVERLEPREHGDELVALYPGLTPDSRWAEEVIRVSKGDRKTYDDFIDEFVGFYSCSQCG
ncbi:MAG: hypothetical protein QNJ30_22195 [Kiloniellales bacterium]|nr:hypothetical protein [Kiloniellales bacterium]